MLDLLAKGTDRGYSMIGVGLSAGLSGSRRARTVQDPLPALDLDWATNRSLPASYGPTPSFSRASTGTYFDGMGVLKTAAVNGPRFDHTYNGTSWVSRGLLVEEQRTNLVTYSTDFTITWAKVDVALLTSAGTAPDGTNTAVKMYPTSSTIMTRIYRSAAYSCISVFAKAAEKSIVYFYDLAGVNVCWFNLSSGTIGTNNTGLTASMVNCSNGWFRCSLASSSNFQFFQIGVSDANGSLSSTASGTNGILIWGAQGESGSFPTSYIPTTSASATRSADVCQITGGDFSSFWNASEGSIAVDYDSASPVGSTTIAYPVVSFSDLAANVKRIWYTGEGALGGNRFYLDNNAGSSTALVLPPIAGGSIPTRASAGWKLNDVAASLNGGSCYLSASQIIPTGIDILKIGNNPASGNQMCGHIARLRYYPTRLTNAKLQELST